MCVSEAGQSEASIGCMANFHFTFSVHREKYAYGVGVTLSTGDGSTRGGWYICYEGRAPPKKQHFLFTHVGCPLPLRVVQVGKLEWNQKSFFICKRNKIVLELSGQWTVIGFPTTLQYVSFVHLFHHIGPLFFRPVKTVG